MFSHVDRLPVELIARCFSLSTEGSTPTLSLREPPISLLLVCRRWRDIALSMPRLWSQVLAEINVRMYDKESTMSTFKAWLSRSKSLPLDIFIKDIDWRAFFSSSEIIFPIILDQASRIHELHLNVAKTPTIPDDLPLFPALRKVTLLTGEDTYREFNDLHRLLEKAPVLDSLTLPSLMVDDQFSDAFYQQLVKLRVVSAPWYTFVDMELVLEGLSRFSNLKVLAIDSMRNNRFIEDDGEPTAAVELPRLLDLSVRADDTRLYPAILRSLCSPVLESISLDVPFYQTGARHAFYALSHLFETHSSTIRSLTYHVTYAMEERLTRGTHVSERMRSYVASTLNDPSHYDFQNSMYRTLWSNAPNVEALVLCDHTECSITWLECLCTFIVRFDEDNPLLVVDSTSHMHQLRDLTIQLRPIASEWYLDRLVTIIYNIVASRIRLRQTTTFENTSSSNPNSDHHCFELRLVFIIDPPLSSIFIQDKTDTASNVPLPELYSPRACIDQCISTIRDKLHVFVSPAKLQHEQLDPNRSGNLDLSFDVLQEEKDMYCQENFDVPYDVRFVPKREIDQRWDEYDEFFDWRW